jgi:hypothetical protein
MVMMYFNNIFLTEMFRHFVGYLYVMDLINAWKMENI